MAKNTKATAQTITSKDVGTVSAADLAGNTSAEVVKTATSVSKADKARAIFEQSYADPKSVPARKDILKRCVEEAGLTPAGAATYLQNYKRDHGLVKKTDAPAA